MTSSQNSKPQLGIHATTSTTTVAAAAAAQPSRKMETVRSAPAIIALIEDDDEDDSVFLTGNSSLSQRVQRWCCSFCFHTLPISSYPALVCCLLLESKVTVVVMPRDSTLYIHNFLKDMNRTLSQPSYPSSLPACVKKCTIDRIPSFTCVRQFRPPTIPIRRSVRRRDIRSDGSRWKTCRRGSRDTSRDWGGEE